MPAGPPPATRDNWTHDYLLGDLIWRISNRTSAYVFTSLTAVKIQAHAVGADQYAHCALRKEILHTEQLLHFCYFSSCDWMVYTRESCLRAVFWAVTLSGATVAVSDCSPFFLMVGESVYE